jgi:predicted dithiol-disulfide oxidoreductase (DUF899 family)
MAKARKLKPALQLAKTGKECFPNESKPYRRAREKLLVKEIELRRAMEAVAEARRGLPQGGEVPEDYIFDGLKDDGNPGKVKLSQLFATGKNSLIIYNFMFPRYSQDRRPGPAEGATAQLNRSESPCPSCVAFIDQLDGAAAHVAAAGFNFVVIAQAPLDRVLGFAKDRGWRHIRFLSSAGTTFKHDYHAQLPDGEQMPMLTVFHRKGGKSRHFWSSEMFYLDPDPGQDPRHSGTLEPLWNLMDLTPEGRPKKWQEQLQYET